MYNKVIMMGRIVNDLELRSTPAGASVLSFRIAVDRRFQTKGEDVETDIWTRLINNSYYSERDAHFR